jgi:hypothetical protein
MRDDWAVELYAGIAKQAVRDYRAGYRHLGIMDAGTWLKLAGLLGEDGTFEQRGYGRIQEDPMATLNQDEQATVDAYTELERAVRYGERHRDEQQLASFRQRAEWAQNNAEAREQFQQQRKAEKDAEAAAAQARHEARALEAQEAYKRTAQATFPGTQAQFDAAWPDLLKAWQIRNTASDMNALIERKRQQMAGML